jgi:hypothetical protein
MPNRNLENVKNIRTFGIMRIKTLSSACVSCKGTIRGGSYLSGMNVRALLLLIISLASAIAPAS